MKKLISILSGFLILVATSTISFASVATVNVVQIFGTIDPSKINDYKSSLEGMELAILKRYEPVESINIDSSKILIVDF